MRFRISWKIALIVLLLLVLTVIWWASRRLTPFVTDLGSVIDTELEAQLNREVTIESARIVSRNRVAITGLRVAQGESFDDGTLFTARRIVADLDLVSVLLGGSVVANVRGVTLVDPRLVLIRNRDGTWNIQDLLERPPALPTERFRGVIRIDSGRVTLRDYESLLARQPAVNTIGSIDGAIDLRRNNIAQINLSGRGIQGLIGGMTLTGPIGLNAPRLTALRLRVTGADAGYWLDYFSAIRAWSLRGGVLDGNALIYQAADGRFTERGTATVTGGAITSPYLAIPLRRLAADVSFEGTRIDLRVDATVRESPVRVAGTIVAGDSLDLRVSSDRMDPVTLQQAIRPLPTVPNTRWPVPMTFTARVFGPTGRPRVEASASIPRAVVYGIPAAGIAASGTYAGGIVRITSLRARVAQGILQSTAIVRLSTGSATIRGTLNNVRLAQLPLPTNVAITGVTDARFTLEWLRGFRSGTLTAAITSGRIGDFRFAGATVRGTFTGPRTLDAFVTTTRGSLQNVAVTSARANLALRGDTIRISQGVIDTARGVIRTSGTVTTAGRLNLAVSATGVNLQALLGPLGYRQASGIASFDGRLTGTISAPLLVGSLAARNGRIQQIAFDLLRARLTATPNYLLLTDATIVRQGARIATSGFIRIARGAPPEVDLRITARRLGLAQFQQLTGLAIDATGTADVDLRITGRAPNLRFAGTIAVTDATIAGFQVDSARVVLRTVDNRTRIDQFVATRDGMRLIGSGFIGARGELSVALRGENLSLSLLNEALAPYVVLSGPMTFNGTVAGTLSNPTLRSELISGAPEVNSVPFDRLAGSIRWDGTTLSLLDASLTRADILYRIPRFSLNTRADSIVLDTNITSARLERLLALFRNSPYIRTPEGEALREALATIPDNAAGEIDASLNLSGPVGNISGTGRVVGTSVILGPQTIDTLEIGFVAQRSLLRFRDLTVRSPGVDLTASAQFVEAQPTSFTARITDTSAASLVSLIENMPFLPAFEFGQQLVSTAQSIPRPVSGTIDATVSVARIQTGSTGDISVSITDLSLGNQEIGNVVADARLLDGTAFIEQLTIVGPLGTANIRGDVGPDRNVSLTGRVEGVSLALLGPLIGVPGLTGTLSMDIRSTGPLDDPSIEASVLATDVSTRNVTLQSITIPSLVIEAGRITAPEIVTATDGSRIVASASLPFSWETPFIPRDQPIDIRVSLPTQDLGELTHLMPLVESASGTLAANLGITGTIAEPVTSGSLIIQNGMLNVAHFDNDFRDLQVDATFSDSTLQINRFTGASSLGGTFTVTGAVQLPSLSRAVIDATLAMDALRLATDNLTGVYGEEVTMTATGLLNITESLCAPLIAGNLVVSDAVIDIPAGEIPAGGPPGYAGPNPRFDITLNLASNVRIEQGPLQVEVVGPVSIAGTLAQPDIIGTVALTEGSLRYPGRTFTLVPGGSATFVWNAPEPPSIAIDLRATTRVLAPSPFFARFARYTIYLDVSGTIDSPVITVSSSPPGLSEQEALALIFRQAEIEALLTGTPIQEVIEQQLSATLLGLALPGIFEGIELGPFTVGIEAGFTVPFQAWISLQVTERLAISYLQTLISGDQYSVIELSYLLSPQYAFSIQVQDFNEALYLLQAGWRF